MLKNIFFWQQKHNICVTEIDLIKMDMLIKVLQVHSFNCGHAEPIPEVFVSNINSCYIYCVLM